MGSRFLQFVAPTQESYLDLKYTVVQKRARTTQLWQLLILCCKTTTCIQLLGCVVYTDHWYTKVPLTCQLYEKYGMFFYGMLNLIEKKACQDLDPPFLKLSRGAFDMLQQGWFCEAAVELATTYRRLVRIQQTVWKDKKHVSFLHTNNIGPNSGHFVLQSTHGAAGWKTFPVPNAQVNYARHYNAVDWNDCDSSDYTTSLCTDHWYICIFFWLLDRVVHQTFVTTVYHASIDVGVSDRNTYHKKMVVSDFKSILAVS